MQLLHKAFSRAQRTAGTHKNSAWQLAISFAEVTIYLLFSESDMTITVPKPPDALLLVCGTVSMCVCVLLS